MSGALLSVTLPSGCCALMARRGQQTADADLVQDPPDPRNADRDVVVALKVHCDLFGAELVLLAQPEDLLHHLSTGASSPFMPYSS